MAYMSVPADSPFLVTATGAGALTASAVRQKRYAAPSRGVRIPVDVADRAGVLHAAALLTGAAGSVLCDVSAAAHWGLPLPPWIALATEPVPVAVAVAPGSSRQ